MHEFVGFRFIGSDFLETYYMCRGFLEPRLEPFLSVDIDSFKNDLVAEGHIHLGALLVDPTPIRLYLSPLRL